MAEKGQTGPLPSIEDRRGPTSDTTDPQPNREQFYEAREGDDETPSPDARDRAAFTPHRYEGAQNERADQPRPKLSDIRKQLKDQPF